jgi:uncharacterized protein (TIGR02145 family)
MKHLTLFFLAIILLVSVSASFAQNEVKDFDNNVYKTVQIGTQLWMAENLKVMHYRNGDPIPNVTDNKEWGKLKTGAYCNYNNCNDPKNDTFNVRLYNWHTVNDPRNLCPAGWHVPTDAEWTTLINFLGSDKIAGGNMKETGTTHWAAPNAGATNSSGFTALPSGARSLKGGFKHIGNTGGYWTSTEYETLNAWHRNMSFSYPFIVRDINAKAVGLSIRCMKN